jgi:hypothetical protein
MTPNSLGCPAAVTFQIGPFSCAFFSGSRLIKWSSELFAEIAISAELDDELVREIGTYRPLPQKAKVPDHYEQTPEELEDDRWAQLLSGQCRVEEDDDFEMPF